MNQQQRDQLWDDFEDRIIVALTDLIVKGKPFTVKQVCKKAKGSTKTLMKHTTLLQRVKSEARASGTRKGRKHKRWGG